MRESPKYPKLNLPALKLRVERHADGIHVWDELRGRFLLLTPEEWVRRHAIGFLCSHAGADKHSIAQEYPVLIEGMAQRADIVLISRSGSPLLLAECKAPEVPLDKKVFAQAVRYNSVLGARYLMITNGLSTRIFELCENGEYRPLEKLPQLF